MPLTIRFFSHSSFLFVYLCMYIHTHTYTYIYKKDYLHRENLKPKFKEDFLKNKLLATCNFTNIKQLRIILSSRRDGLKREHELLLFFSYFVHNNNLPYGHLTTNGIV